MVKNNKGQRIQLYQQYLGKHVVSTSTDHYWWPEESIKGLILQDDLKQKFTWLHTQMLAKLSQDSAQKDTPLLQWDQIARISLQLLHHK